MMFYDVNGFDYLISGSQYHTLRVVGPDDRLITWYEAVEAWGCI